MLSLFSRSTISHVCPSKTPDGATLMSAVKHSSLVAIEFYKKKYELENHCIYTEKRYRTALPTLLFASSLHLFHAFFCKHNHYFKLMSACHQFTAAIAVGCTGPTRPCGHCLSLAGFPREPPHDILGFAPSSFRSSTWQVPLRTRMFRGQRRRT